MTELLNQAFVLTGWGMGMTFLSIGALVLAMYMMTILVKDRTAPPTDSKIELGANSEENDGIIHSNDDQNMAVAASVAVAIALSQESEEKQYTAAEHIAVPAVWDHYVRGHHLAQRSRYDQLKHRR